MVDPFGERRGEFAYGAILERLTQINESLLEEGGGEEQEEVAQGEAGASDTAGGAAAAAGAECDSV
jgi:hypothetical protein